MSGTCPPTVTRTSFNKCRHGRLGLMQRSESPIALQAVGLAKAFGPVQANRDISLTAQSGTIHAVVGENGAGKSTLMRMLQGVEQPDAGQILVGGSQMFFRDPGAALAHGIGMVHQEFMMAPDLSLLENLVLGEEPVRRGWGPFAQIDWARAEAEGQALADQIGARIDWHRRTASAPVHILQFVEIIRLLRRGCRVLILDEPTAVLAPPQVLELFALLRNLRDGGTTILFISHKIGEVMALADEVTVIRQGETVFHAAVAETSADEISRHIVKGEVAEVTPSRSTGIGAPVLGLQGLSTLGTQKSQALRDISLEVHAGEILGVAGVSGNGQSELVECIAGLRDLSAGRITLHTTDITGLGSGARRDRGLAYVSADRRNEGLSPQASIETNVVAGSHRAPPIQSGLLLNRTAMRSVAGNRLAALDVTYGTLDDPAASLSGGNQQKLVFAREIATDPRLLIASQPTRGVDLNGIAAIHQLIRRFRDQGGAVLLVSEELDELVTLSDRVVVLSNGAVVGTIDAPAGQLQTIGQMMVRGGVAA